MNQQGLVAIGMSDPAAEPDQLLVLDLPQYSVAFGAGHRGWDTGLHMPIGKRELVGFLVGRVAFWHGRYLERARRFDGQVGQELGHFGNRKHVVHCHIIDGTLGHTRIQRGIETLDQCQAAVLLNSEQSCGAVVQIAREHDSNHSGAELMGGRPEERIDCGSMAILFGPPAKTKVPVAQMKVEVGKGHINSARLDRLTVSGVPGRKRACSVEDPG
jgi:hypothetical protein